jgi:molybdate transport system regulatory protein
LAQKLHSLHCTAKTFFFPQGKNMMDQESSVVHPVFQCALSLQAGHDFLDESRLHLLREIREKKTLSAAAEALKISYKTAWSWLEAMNNAASGPLVKSIQGGAAGGTSTLTELGEKLLSQYEDLCERHRLFMESFEKGEQQEMLDITTFLRRLSLCTSARNQLHGKVERIWGDKAQAWVDVMVDDLAIITSRVTRSTISDMGLGIGSEVVALIKATCMNMGSPEEAGLSLPKGPINRLQCTLVRAVIDENYAQATFSISNNRTLSALVPISDWTLINPRYNEKYFIWFNPNHVILARLS